MSGISAVIITLNEEKNISRCLESVTKVADEIIIIDSFSEDRTVEISKSYSARVEQVEWKGYAKTKNYGNSLATNDYILSIDADEVISPQLVESILSVKEELTGAYSFNRLTNYCGKWIYHSGWYPDVKIRLFNRKETHWVGDYVHEELKFNAKPSVHHLQGDLWHFSFDSLEDHLQRVNKYSTLAAQELASHPQQFFLAKMLLSPIAKFLKVYLLQQGFRDGFYGFCIASISAFDIFIRYAKTIHLIKTGVKSSSPE